MRVTGVVVDPLPETQPVKWRCRRCGMKIREGRAKYCSAVCRDRQALYRRMGIV